MHCLNHYPVLELAKPRMQLQPLQKHWSPKNHFSDVEKLLRCSDASGSFFLQAQLCLIPKWTHRFCWCLASTNTIWIEKKWESEVGPSSLLVVSYDPAGLSWFWSWLFYGNHLPEFSFFRSIICIRAGVQQPMLFPIRTLPNSSSANGGHILCN